MRMGQTKLTAHLVARTQTGLGVQHSSRPRLGARTFSGHVIPGRRLPPPLVRQTPTGHGLASQSIHLLKETEIPYGSKLNLKTLRPENEPVFHQEL